MTAQATVVWTAEKLKQFKEAFSRALEEQRATGSDVFVFDGNEYVIGYARYLIEYLEQLFGKVQ